MTRRRSKPEKEPTEFSKKLLYAIFFATAVIIAFTLAIVWRTGDTSPLAYLIPAIFVEVATATGFYYWKAKVENQIKLQGIYNIQPETPNEEEESV